jgi:hypothetical protein
VSRASVERILQKDLNFHPYKLQIVQELTAEHRATRVEFARQQLALIESDSEYPMRIMMSDEALFHCHGGANRQNCRYWSDSNPHWYSEKPLHSDKVMVWMSMGSTGIIGPFFFDGENVNAASYSYTA